MTTKHPYERQLNIVMTALVELMPEVGIHVFECLDCRSDNNSRHGFSISELYLGIYSEVNESLLPFDEAMKSFVRRDEILGSTKQKGIKARIAVNHA